MSEPEFYTIKRSGILFGDGVYLSGSYGSHEKYYGISRELFDQLKAAGKISQTESYWNLHTWENWGLFCTDVSIDSPEVEQNTVSVPGRHGILDYSEALTGAPVFHNRTITFSFVKLGSMESWHDLYSEILHELHGKQTYFVIDTDPWFYYTGRCSVSSVREDGVYSSFTITVDADPFKYSVRNTLSDWLWDPFSFETGVIQDYKNCLTLSAGESGSVTVYGYDGYVYPVIVFDFEGKDGGTVRLLANAAHGIKGDTFTVPSGTPVGFTMSSSLRSGENTLNFQCDESNTSACTISIGFREVRL